MISTEDFISDLKEELLLHLEYCSGYLSESSYIRRISQLYNFDQYLVERLYSKPNAIDYEIVHSWIKRFENMADQTVMTYVNALRKFLIFLSKISNISVYVPPTHKCDDSYIPYIFTDEEMARIYEIIDNYVPGITNTLPFIQIEYPLIIRLLDSNGFRLNELITSKRKDINLSTGVFSMLNTKNERQRFVPITDAMNIMIQQYCERIKIINKPDAYLFPRRDITEPLLRADISSRFRDTLIAAQIRTPGTNSHQRGPCVHCLRHRFTFRSVKQLMAAGIHMEDSIPYLSIYLGHSSLNETEKYLKFVAEWFPDEIKKFDDFSDSIFPDLDIWNDWMI